MKIRYIKSIQYIIFELKLKRLILKILKIGAFYEGWYAGNA